MSTYGQHSLFGGGGGGGGGGISGPGVTTVGTIPTWNSATGLSLQNTNLSYDNVTLGVNNELTIAGPLFSLKGATDRTRIEGDVIEIHPKTIDNQFIYIADRQLTLVSKNLYFEQNGALGTWGDIWWEGSGISDIGMSTRDNPGVKHAPRDIYLERKLVFGPNGQNQNIQTNGNDSILAKASDFRFYDSTDNFYLELLLNVSGLHLLQTNCDMRMNGGNLIFASQNGTPNGLRCFTVTLTGSSTVVANASVTPNTVALINGQTLVNPGFLGQSVVNGQLTITSTSSTDASTVFVTLIQNG